MTFVRSSALWVADHLNPVVVKELRQAVQSRLVSAILMLFLLGNVIVMGSYLLLSRDVTADETAGRIVFMWLYGIAVFTCMIFVPLYAGVRLAMERNDVNIDLLFVTTISPWAIIRGKFLAAVALTCLIYSTCVPFIAFTYLLRGIDLPSIFLALALGLVSTAALIMVSILIASISGNWLLRLLLALGMLILMVLSVIYTIVGGVLIAQFGAGVLFEDRDAWIGWLLGSFSTLASWGLCYLLAVAAISARSSNRMFPVRVYLTIVWILFGLLQLLLLQLYGQFEPLIVWAEVSAGFFCAVLLFIVAERDYWTPRVRRNIPRLGLFRLLAWIYYTGSAGGVIWCVTLIVASLGLGWFCYMLSGLTGYSAQYMEQSLQWMTGMSLFAFSYIMTGVLIRRLLFPSFHPVFAPIFAVVLFVAGCILPLLTGFMIYRHSWQFDQLPVPFLLFSPYILSDEMSQHWVVAYLFLILWAGLGIVLNLPWFTSQWEAFVRYERRSQPPPAPTPILVELR